MKIDTNKILLAGGCSYTAPNRSINMGKPIPIIPMWCDNLSEQYDMKLVNLGIGGTGNSFIAQRINEYIITNHKKIGLVCILWSGWERLSFYNHERWMILPNLSNYIIPKNIKLTAEVYFKQSASKKFISLLEKFPSGIDSTIVDSIIKHNIMAFNSVETLCKLYNIPYVFMQGVYLGSYIILNKFYNRIFSTLESILANEHLIDESKFIGWPLDERLGGFCYPTIRDRYTKFKGEWDLVPGFDNHPNEIAHEYIAKYIHKGIEEIYEN